MEHLWKAKNISQGGHIHFMIGNITFFIYFFCGGGTCQFIFLGGEVRKEVEINAQWSS